MKLTRQILVVFAVVAVIMALGFAWQHSPAASLVADHGHGKRGGGFDLSHADDLVQSLMILGLIIGGVVVVDRVRRWRSPVVSGGRSRP
jgi:hypothetical protein